MKTAHALRTLFILDCLHLMRLFCHHGSRSNSCGSPVSGRLQSRTEEQVMGDQQLQEKHEAERQSGQTELLRTTFWGRIILYLASLSHLQWQLCFGIKWSRNMFCAVKEVQRLPAHLITVSESYLVPIDVSLTPLYTFPFTPILVEYCQRLIYISY